VWFTFAIKQGMKKKYKACNFN